MAKIDFDSLKKIVKMKSSGTFFYKEVYLQKISIGTNLEEYVSKLNESGIRFSNGIWLCGGAIRRAVCGHDIEAGDFDIYVNNSKFAEIQKLDADNNWGLAYKAGKSHMRTQEGQINGLKVQFHVLYEDMTLVKLLGSFDFTCCQLGFDGENGWQVDPAVEHARTMKLQYTGVGCKTTIPRAFRFMDMGFKPGKSFLKEMQELSFSEFSVSGKS